LKLIRRIRDAEREAIASIFEVLAEDGTRCRVKQRDTFLFRIDPVIFTLKTLLLSRLHLKDLTHACAELKPLVFSSAVYTVCLRAD